MVQLQIGKSVWILYALRRRLAERKPVIWYYMNTCYLFIEDGVYTMLPGFLQCSFKAVVWTLADSDQEISGPPGDLMAHGTPFYVIFVTSPVKQRWARMDKTTRRTIAVMNPWTKAEIGFA